MISRKRRRYLGKETEGKDRQEEEEEEEESMVSEQSFSSCSSTEQEECPKEAPAAFTKKYTSLLPKMSHGGHGVHHHDSLTEYSITNLAAKGTRNTLSDAYHTRYYTGHMGLGGDGVHHKTNSSVGQGLNASL